MVTVAFEQECKTNAAKRGMPRLRLVFSPHPVWGKTPEQLWGYMNGPDPGTQKPMMQEVIGALTSASYRGRHKDGKGNTFSGAGDIRAGHGEESAGILPE